MSDNYMGGNNYMSDKYIGGRNYMSHKYMGHNYMAPTWTMMSMAIEMVSPRRP